MVKLGKQNFGYHLVDYKLIFTKIWWLLWLEFCTFLNKLWMNFMIFFIRHWIFGIYYKKGTKMDSLLINSEFHEICHIKAVLLSKAIPGMLITLLPTAIYKLKSYAITT